MAEDGVGTVGEDGRHPVSLARELGVADREHTLVDAVQAPDGHAVLNRIATQPDLEELPYRNYAVLLLGQRRDQPVDHRTRLRFGAIVAPFLSWFGDIVVKSPERTDFHPAERTDFTPSGGPISPRLGRAPPWGTCR